MFLVQARQCSSCIYLPGVANNLQKLEAAVADPKMKGFFKGYRECHHATRGSGVCCRGFWDAHRNDCTVGQLAQRLNCVSFVNVDALADTDGHRSASE